MDLKKIEYFCAIVEHGSLINAAKFLHISQPPLSLHLKELEEELGYPLFVRQGKKMILTQDGNAFYAKSVKLLRYFDEFSINIRQKHSENKEIINIGVSSSYEFFIQSLFREISALPGVQHIQLGVVSSIHVIEQALQQKKIDFAITRHPLSYSNYIISKLMPFQYMAVYPKSIPAPQKEKITVADLKDIDLLLPKAWMDKSTLFNTYLKRLFSEENIVPHIILETDINDILLAFLRYGTQAVTFLPSYYLHREDVKDLIFKPLEQPLIFDPILIYRSDSHLTEPVRSVIDCILKKYKRD